MALHSIIFSGKSNILRATAPLGFSHGIWDFAVQSILLKGRQPSILHLGIKLSLVKYHSLLPDSTVSSEEPILCMFRSEARKNINSSAVYSFQTDFCEVSRTDDLYIHCTIVDMLTLQPVDSDLVKEVNFTVLVHSKRRK